MIEKKAWAYMWKGAYLQKNLYTEKCDILKSLVAEIFLQPIDKIYVRKTTNVFGCNKTVPSYRLSTSVLYFFMIINSAKSQPRI